jgi:alkaline phosphatase
MAVRVCLFLVLFASFAASRQKQVRCEDLVARLQKEAVQAGIADWAHWGPNPASYSSWTSHTSRLIPIYSFGADLNPVRGVNSPYRSEDRIRDLFGHVPAETLNRGAEYFDQTGVHFLQELAAKSGKRCIVLVVFDGMDWQTTQAASIYKLKRVAYTEGRGTGLHFQDYRGATTDYGYFVTSPHNEGTRVDINAQRLTNPGGDVRGGYSPRLGGDTPWTRPQDTGYLIGKGETLKHAYPDSAATATAMTSGVKTYNDSINVDPVGRHTVPIARVLQEQGYAIGVVTSVPISHATPACAYANNVHRDDYQDLTRDLLGLRSVSHPTPLAGVDVLIGAGWNEEKTKDGNQGSNFVAGNRYLTDQDRAAADQKYGGKYLIVERAPGGNGGQLLAVGVAQANAHKHRLLGFFGAKGGHLPFGTADGNCDPVPSVGQGAELYSTADIAENPTLAQMATGALDVLVARSDKMWLMVEAGDVDWANHANNLDNSIGAVLSGDDAFAAIASWIEKNVGWDDAALFLTADHGHYLVLDRPEALAGK